ncbi:MAG: hypothetical protein Q4C25_06950, partial [Bacillota bacterium]|nr:hypothetical protein [Bacillota bacterium]
MTEQEILALLHRAHDSIRQLNKRESLRLMNRAEAEIRILMERASAAQPAVRAEVGPGVSENPTAGHLLGEWYLLASMSEIRDMGRRHQLLEEAARLLDGPSRVIPRGAAVFGDFCDVFSMCNTRPGHAVANGAKLAEIVKLFYKLTGGGTGADVCYHAQLEYYRGDLINARRLAKEAFSMAEQNGQKLTALCAAEVLANIGKHEMDLDLWRFAAGYIRKAADLDAPEIDGEPDAGSLDVPGTFAFTY